MKWEEYVNFSSDNDNCDSAARISFKFGDSNIVEPSFFTRLNCNFLKTISDIYEKNKIALILPKHSKLLASLVLYKIIYEINTGETKSLSLFETFKVGDKLKLHDAVVEFDGIEESSYGKSFWVKTGGKTYNRTGWKLEFTPPFVKALPNEKLTGQTTLKRAIEIWNADKKSSLSNLVVSKALRDKTTIIVGPTNQYKKMFKNTLINEKKLSDVISVGFVDSECNVKPLTEQTDYYDLILCPDAYSAYELLNDSISENVCSIFFDISSNECPSDYLQWVRKIERFNKTIIFCIQENHPFDLTPLVEANYSIFQWKKNYITEHFIFDDKNPDSLLLFAFKERTFERVVFKDETLEKWYSELRRYQDEMQDSDPTLVNAFYQYFLELINICKNYCFQDNDFMLERKKILQQKIDNLENPYIKNIIGNHPLIQIFKDMINDILNFYSRDNSKAEFIVSYLIDHPKEKNCIVVPDSKHFNVELINDYLKSNISSMDIDACFDVLSVSSYKECSKEYDTAIFVGWNSKNIMREALFSNNAYKNIVLLYTFERPWMDFAIKEWNNNSYKNDFTILDPTIEAPEDEPLLMLENEEESPEAATFVESYDEVKTKLNSTLANNKKAHVEYGNNEFIEAALVNFADDTYGIFSRFKTFVCINELLKGNETKPSEKTTEDLMPGDIILFKDKSKNIITEIATGILNANNQGNLIYLARSWKDAIRDLIVFGGIDKSKIVDKIVEAGCKRHKLTIRGWVYSEATICPIDKEDLVCIAAACGEFGADLLENIDSIYSAASVVRRAHIQAGFKLSDMILNTTEIKNIVDGYDEFGYFDFPSIEIDNPQLGHITITKVTDVGEFQDYPESICDLREDN